MRGIPFSITFILFISIFGCLISTGEPISTDDISEEVNPYFNEVGSVWGQSLGNFGDYIVSCERHSGGLYDSGITVRNLSGGVLWDKDLSCVDTKISESGNVFLALNRIKNFTTYEYTAYILGFYNTNSSNPVWEYVIQCPELNCNGAPKIGISGDGEFAAFANVSGLHYFSRESNTPLWVSAPFSQYQIRQVNNFGRSNSSSTDGYHGIEFSEYGRVVVSTGSAIHLFENDSNIPAWSKDYFQTNHFPTVNLAKISLDGEHIGYVSGIPNNESNGTEYLEEHHILLLSNGTEYYNYSSETVFLDPHANGFFSDHRGQVDLSSNGSSAIFVGNDFDERKTLHFVSDYGLSHYTSQFEDFIGDTGAPRPNYDSFTVASLADNGESVFVGLRSGKYLLLLNKTLVPLKKFSPIIGTHSALEEYTLQDIMWSKFDSIQTSRQGSLVSISGGYRFVDSTSGGDKGVSATWIYLTSIDDSDVDYDGWRDVEELECGFNPTDVTSSPTDMDNDSICDSLDDDDDNDGYADSEDYFPFDPTEWVDTDFDDIGDNSDLDDDGDGWFDDVEDICLTDRLNHLSYPTDTDLDDICDYLDDDDDGDDVLDVDDLFPLDGTEISDFDMDGIGDNSDLDDDNDGWSDSQEISCDSDPRDSLNLPNDLDNDWICDSNDLDKDGDGYIDQVELNCGSDHLDVSSFPPDFDEDGTCDILDFDYDGDNVTNSEDAFPFDPNEWNDTDEDGLGDNTDIDIDNDGFTNQIEQDCGSDPMLNNSTPEDSDSNGICDNLESQNSEKPSFSLLNIFIALIALVVALVFVIMGLFGIIGGFAVVLNLCCLMPLSLLFGGWGSLMESSGIDDTA